MRKLDVANRVFVAWAKIFSYQFSVQENEIKKTASKFRFISKILRLLWINILANFLRKKLRNFHKFFCSILKQFIDFVTSYKSEINENIFDPDSKACKNLARWMQILQDGCKSCKMDANLARWMQILQKSCKMDTNLARFLQEKRKNYAFPCKISCKILNFFITKVHLYFNFFA